MNVKYLIPFVDAAYEVLKAEAHYQMKRGQLSLEKGPYITEEVTVLLSLVGDITGTVFYSMSIHTVLNIISVI